MKWDLEYYAEERDESQEKQKDIIENLVENLVRENNIHSILFRD